MKQTINLKVQKFPKIVGELISSNQFLKIFAAASLGVAVLAICALYISITRPPIVLAFGADARPLDQIPLPKEEDMVKAAVMEYIKYRYNWTPETVKENLARARDFIHPSSLRQYDSSAAGVVKFSLEKIVSQKVYPEKIEVDLKKQIVRITGDRVTTVQGLKAAGYLTSEVTFTIKTKKNRNPWNIHITKEIGKP